MAWNDDATCLAVGTVQGMILYSSEFVQAGDACGLVEIAKRDIPGGVSVIAIVGRFPMVLFCGHVEDKRRVVTLWDDSLAERTDMAPSTPIHQKCIVAELPLQHHVEALRCHPRVIVIATMHRVLIFDSSLALVDTFEMKHTANFCNTIAMASVSVPRTARGEACSVLRMLLPGTCVGEVCCVGYHWPTVQARPFQLVSGHSSARSVGSNTSSIHDRPKSYLHRVSVVPAPHNSKVFALAVCADGSKGMSVSENGRSIKLIELDTAKVICQFNRGMQFNTVRCIALNADATLASCVSQTGTVHVFNLVAVKEAGSALSNAVSNAAYNLTPSFLANLPPVANAVASAKSTPSFAKFTITSTDEDELHTGTGTDSQRAFADGAGSSGPASAVAAAAAAGAVDATFSCVAFRSGQVDGNSVLFVALGVPGFHAQAGVKCKCVRLTVNPNPRCKCSEGVAGTKQCKSADMCKATCKLWSTHLFPKDEL